MKIIVLGNGFDLATNLPTSYKDFFKYSHNVHEDDFKVYTDFLENKNPTEHRAFRNNTMYSLGMKETKQYASEEIKQLFEDIVKRVEEEVSNALSVWDIFFLKNFENKKEDVNWHFVEEKIKNEIVKKSDKRNNKRIFQFLRNCNPDKTEEIETETGVEGRRVVVPRFYKDYLGSKTDNANPVHGNSYSNEDEKSYRDDVLYKLDKTEFFIFLLIKKRYAKKLMNFYQILLEELILFEKSFAAYIELLTKKTILRGSGQTTYRNNLLKLSDKSEDKYYLINFNYTEFSSKREKAKFEIKRSPRKIKVIQQNVHGVYYDKVIFGIDQSSIEASSDEYMFTKTFRKMDYYENFENIPLPNKEDVSEIIFYGHSLAEADYSYFQSIFDYYSIYDSDVTINFSYSVYGDTSDHWKIKQRKLQDSVKVVEKYSQTLANKDRGKNLMHKLLLENRLKFKKIELEKVNVNSLKEYFEK